MDYVGRSRPDPGVPHARRPRGRQISITIQQSDVDRAIHRAALLAKATGRDAIAIVAGATEEAGLDRRHAQALIVPEQPGPVPRQ